MRNSQGYPTESSGTSDTPVQINHTQLMKKQAHTIVIGAGQSGLSVSYLLTKKGIDHLILEKEKVADGVSK